MRNLEYPLVVIDDDLDDLDLFIAAYNELEFKNELFVFHNTDHFIEFLKTARNIPFLVVSDYNMPQVNGIKLRQFLNSHPEMRYKSIPFVIWTTTINNQQVKLAYDSLVQGYFEKPPEFQKFKLQLKALIDYWMFSFQPNIQI